MNIGSATPFSAGPVIPRSVDRASLRLVLWEQRAGHSLSKGQLLQTSDFSIAFHRLRVEGTLGPVLGSILL